MANARKTAELVITLDDQFTREANAIRRSLKSLGDGLSSVGRGLTAGLTAPLLALGTVSLKAFADFETAMANVSTLVDETTESMGEMRTAVLDIGDRTPVALNELTAALYDIRSAGIAAGDAMAVLEQSARLGVAGLGSTKEAADLATSSINAFALTGAEQARVYELLFRTVAAGKTTIGELAQGFGGVAGTVAQAGVDLDEFLASVAALTTTGAPASQSMTQIRAAIVGLTRDSEDTQAVLGKLGARTFAELVQKSGGLVAALKRIVAAVNGDAAALIKLTGSVEGYSAIVGLTGRQNEAFNRTLEGMRSGVESLDAAADKKAGALGAKFLLLRNQLTSIGVAIGEDLLPQVEQLVDFIGEVVAGFRELDPGLKAAIVQFGLWAAAVGPVLLVLGTLIQSIGVIIGALTKLRLLMLAGFGPGGLVLAGLVLIGGAIAGWAGSVNDASTALEGHKRLVDRIKGAYEAAGRSVAAMSKEVRDKLLVETTVAAKQLRESLDSSLGDLLSRKLPILLANVDFGPLTRQLTDGVISLEKFRAGIAAIGAANPDKAELSLAILELTEEANTLTASVAESDDYIAFLTGTMSGAAFAAKHLGADLAAVAEAAPAAAITETTKAVEDLGRSIKVVRFGAEGVTTETVQLVDGVAQLARKGSESLAALGQDATAAAADVTAASSQVAGAIRSVPEALAGKESPAEALTEGLDGANTKFRETTTTANDAATSIGQGATNAGTAWGEVGTAAQAAFAGLPETARLAADAVLLEIGRIDAGLVALNARLAAPDAESAGALTEALVAPFRIARASIDSIWAGLGEMVAAGFDGVVAGGNQAASGIGTVAQAIAGRLRSELNSIINTLNAALGRIIASIDRAVARLRQAAAEARAAGGGGGGGQGFALGGLIRGPGTGRSDSIPLWGSNGEFMMQAAAVRRYGVDFMRMINSGRLSLKGLIPGYADGGLIGSIDSNGVLDGLAALLGAGTLQPRLALNAPGLAPQRALRPINLTLPGGENFEMLAPENVARKVMQFATGAAVRTAGRKPEWYK